MSGSQMGRMVSDKMKEILQTPTPESKMVDDATLETLEESNWGMNLRICAFISSEEISGTEVVKAIKKKISGKSVASQRLSLDLLETCAMNCEKIFSEIASEKVLEEMVKMIDNPQTDHGNRRKALQLIRGWGESEDLAYLPVFQLTYASLKERMVQEGDSSPPQYSLESYAHQEPIYPPEAYPMPEGRLHDRNNAVFPYNPLSLSDEEKEEFLVVARNSLELLSSILDVEAEPKLLKEDLTLNLLEKCKESQGLIRRIVDGTLDDEVMLVEVLYLNDELQRVLSKYEELEAAQNSAGQQREIAEKLKQEADVSQSSLELLPLKLSSDNSEESQHSEGKQQAKSGTPEATSASITEASLTAGVGSSP